MVFTMTDMFFGLASTDTNKLFLAVYLFATSFAILIIIPPVVAGLVLTYFTGKEITFAIGLRKKLNYIHAGSGLS